MQNSKSKDRQVLILFGAPGSGKGTQAGLLSERLNLYYLETSKILEQKFVQKAGTGFIKADAEKYFFKSEKDLWQKGILCSPPFVTYLLLEKIKELFKEGKNLILAGSPRTLYEAEKEVPLFKNLFGPKNIKIFELKIRPETTIWRNSHRKICELMRHPIVYSKEAEKLTRCPLDGSKLLKRGNLDKPETIKTRLKEYKERTFPLISFFKKQGIKVKEINGEKTVEGVFKDIVKSLK